jgi:excisionase family DNA binding protein
MLRCTLLYADTVGLSRGLIRGGAQIALSALRVYIHGMVEPILPAPADASFVEQVSRDAHAIGRRLHADTSLDVVFLAYLRRLSRFGYFSLGPITLDVNLIEDLVERTVVPGEPPRASEDYARFSSLLMQEVRTSGRKRIDELHYLLAFMKCGEGLPARVFGELGVTPVQIERYLQQTGGAPAGAEPAQQLLTPEEVAEYLKVHVQTVRAWIRTGTLPARRVAGLRALRVRLSDVEKLLKPLDTRD